MGDDSERVLLEPSKAPRIHADGLARVHSSHGNVTFVLYVDPIPVNPQFPSTERHIEAVVTMPLDAVMPAIRMTLWELGKSGVEFVSGDAVKFGGRGH